MKAGDFTLIGWTITLAYLTTSFLCFRRSWAAPAGGSRRVWTAFGLFLLGMGANKQLDLQLVVTDVGRRMAHAQGWYESRGLVQVGFVAGLGLILLSFGLWLLFGARNHLAETALAFAGTSILVLFVLLRAISFDVRDVLLRIGDTNVTGLLELLGTVLIAAAALRRESAPDTGIATATEQPPLTTEENDSMTYNYKTLDIRCDQGVLWATINNPPMNIFTTELYREMLDFTTMASDDAAARVVVVESADPDFWIAHFDVEVLLGFDTSGPNLPTNQLNDFHRMCENVRTMPKATIAKLNGRVGGGGSEFAASFDMRFGDLDKTTINQMEVALGILPGGSGTQRLPRLVGRSRALEIILGCDDLDAATAEAWGYLNRALPKAQLDEHVEKLARRIASFPEPAVRLAKESTLNADKLSIKAGLLEEAHLFQELMRTPQSAVRMKRFLELGGQTREQETRMGALCRDLSEAVQDDEG